MWYTESCMFQLTPNDWAVVIAVLSGGLFVGAILQYSDKIFRSFTRERVMLPTADGKSIAGDYFQGKKPMGVIFLHAMPSTKEAWRDVCAAVQAMGYHALAIDFRGHGESTGGPDGFKNFSDTEHQASILDIDAAAEFLAKKNVPLGGTWLAGASLGANLALMYTVAHRETQGAVLLSPGLSYRGVQAGPLIRELWQGQKVLIASSEDDDRSGGNNADGARVLIEAVPAGCEKKLILYKFSGHGTDMLGREEPDLQTEIINWIEGKKND